MAAQTCRQKIQKTLSLKLAIDWLTAKNSAITNSAFYHE